MTEHIGIGELARRSGRSIHTLRYYESIGLMPMVVRDAGQRRRYHAHHVDWLMFLERLKATGMTLADMQRYAALVASGKQTLGERVAVLSAHLQRIDHEMAELKRSRKLLLSKIAFYEEWQSTGRFPKTWWV
jgi:DNA-binding transcriptional MerR regulator